MQNVMRWTDRERVRERERGREPAREKYAVRNGSSEKDRERRNVAKQVNVCIAIKIVSIQLVRYLSL